MHRYWILLISVLLIAASAFGFSYMSNYLKKPLVSKEALLDLEAEKLLHDPQYAFQFIRTAPADVSYNCHGWTFRAGKRSVSDSEVTEWINSPRYKPIITRPMPNDIVIYYEDNTICHSGVVQSISRNGIILVESKWGSLGRFIHPIDAPQVANRRIILRRTNWIPPGMPTRNDNKGNLTTSERLTENDRNSKQP